MAQVQEAAARFALGLADACSMKGVDGEPIFGADSYSAATPAEPVRAVVVDFVAPGEGNG